MNAEEVRNKINQLRKFWSTDCGAIAKDIGYSKSYVYLFLYDKIEGNRNPIKLVVALNDWYEQKIREWNDIIGK